MSRKEDRKLPNQQKSTLRLRYSMIRHRSSPNITPYNSDDDDVCNPDTSILDAASALNTLGRIESISDDESSMDDNVSL